MHVGHRSVALQQLAALQPRHSFTASGRMMAARTGRAAMLLLVMLAAAAADEEMVVEDEAADSGAEDAAGSPDGRAPPPDMDYEEMMRNMGGGMGGMNNNPYMEKLRRENPELFAGMNMDVSDHTCRTTEMPAQTTPSAGFCLPWISLV